MEAFFVKKVSFFAVHITGKSQINVQFKVMETLLLHKLYFYHTCSVKFFQFFNLFDTIT